MSQKQLSHKHHLPLANKYALSLLASDLTSPQNMGSLFRMADALGLQQIYLSANSPAPPNKKIKKTARSTENYVQHQIIHDEVALITLLKKQGVYVVALEICTKSIDLKSDFFQQIIKTQSAVLLVIGNENSGISAQLLKLVDSVVYIPMLGVNSSMNVATACSIACYEITKHMDLAL